MRIFILVCLLVVSACVPAACAMAPVIANAGFEEVAPGNDAPGWGWYTTAACGFKSETTDPHSGSRCMVFHNESPLTPHIYGRLAQGVGLYPRTKYELSAWVRADQVEHGSHFTDWETYQLDIPVGTYGWRRISTVFTTRDGQGSLNLGINIGNKCKALAIDDITLTPVGTPFKGGLEGAFLVPGQASGDNSRQFVGTMITSPLEAGAKATVVISAGTNNLLSKSVPVESGKWTEVEWNTGKIATDRLDCTIEVVSADGKVLGTGATKIEKLSPVVITSRVNRLRARMKELDSLIERCRAKGIPTDYPMVTRTMLEQFVPLTLMDARQGEERRAHYSANDMERSLNAALSELKAYLADPKLAPNAVRYQTSPTRIDGLSFVQKRVDSRGEASEGPVFFCGHGHFGQVRKDMPRWPGYGVNIIQIEIGPSSVLVKEDKVSLVAAHGILKVLNDAARHNVKVILLLSPHYFPDWAMKKWPHLGKGGGGFLGFTVDAPEAKQVIEKYLRIVVPMFKDHPALHSFCLSNEPLFDRGQGADNTPAMWRDYLAKVHGKVETLNQRYGTSYASFDAVPMPGNGSYGDPQFHDWCVFNQERFADWHAWMADVIRDMAPDVPLHAKMMWIPTSWRQAVSLGIDPELFGQALDVNGNDCSIQPGSDYWGICWWEQNMFYDLQRSVAHKPICNSENHLQPDGSSSYVAPEHYRTALWQGAIHGQGATAIWVWERVHKNAAGAPLAWSACFYGNVMDRPGCAEATGLTCLDLNRFAAEVTALQNVRAPVAVLYSMASYARNDQYLGQLNKAYSALNFSGVKVDFITERMLADGRIGDYRMIVIPEATYTTDAAFEALRKLAPSTRLIMIGDSLAYDSYGKPRAKEQVEELRAKALTFPTDIDGEKALWPALRTELGKLGALPEVSVVDAKTGEPVWGVEWLPAKVGGRTVVNIVDLRAVPFDVKLARNGKQVEARDLLSLGGREKVRTLKPITPVLAEVK